MTDPDKPPGSDLKGRIRAARDRRRARDGAGGSTQSYTGLGVGMRIVAEIISALAVGVALGLILDTWLGTQPWFLIAGFLLGSGAAFMNLMRIAKRMEAQSKAERDARRRSGDGASEG
jgi:ATP synthase protein I